MAYAVGRVYSAESAAEVPLKNECRGKLRPHTFLAMTKTPPAKFHFCVQCQPEFTPGSLCPSALSLDFRVFTAERFSGLNS